MKIDKERFEAIVTALLSLIVLSIFNRMLPDRQTNAEVYVWPLMGLSCLAIATMWAVDTKGMRLTLPRVWKYMKRFAYISPILILVVWSVGWANADWPPYSLLFISVLYIVIQRLAADDKIKPEDSWWTRRLKNVLKNSIL